MPDNRGFSALDPELHVSTDQKVSGSTPDGCAILLQWSYLPEVFPKKYVCPVFVRFFGFRAPAVAGGALFATLPAVKGGARADSARLPGILTGQCVRSRLWNRQR